MTTRKQIRDAVQARVGPAVSAHNPDLEVFTFQKAMVQGYAGLVCVYYEEGESEHSMSDRDDQAALTISIMLTDQDGVDDALDAIGAVIESAIELDPFFGGLLAKCLITGWAYERDISKGWTGLRLTYTTQFDA
ncbi:hypothetical protein [Marinobacterium stanieri]|uniref:hypothetical protein n=1 Tax=Marinobacterium stanieri TaxID=49186 RepID=UPI003A95B5CA